MRVMGFFSIMRVQEEGDFRNKKITRGLARIHVGLERILYLGNLDAKRDCHAKDYVEMQWLMLQQKSLKTL